MADKVGVFLSGLFILACFSYLFKENKFYTYTEHIYVGFGAAQALILGYRNISDGAVTPLFAGRWEYLVPLVLGVMLFARHVNGYHHLARLPLAFMMGAAAGVTITGAIEAQFVKQVRATIMPLTSLNNVIMVLGTVSTVAFFLFIPFGKAAQGGRERPRVLEILSTAGRATMMIAFGSSYGYVVMSRLSYLVARLQFLLGRWLPIIPE